MIFPSEKVTMLFDVTQNLTVSTCSLRERNKTKRNGVMDVTVEQIMFQG